MLKKIIVTTTDQQTSPQRLCFLFSFVAKLLVALQECREFQEEFAGHRTYTLSHKRMTQLATYFLIEAGDPSIPASAKFGFPAEPEAPV